MAHIGNAPDTRSLEQRAFALLKRHPSGVSRAFIDTRFRKNMAQEIDDALRCLLSVGAIAYTGDRWWPR